MSTDSYLDCQDHIHLDVQGPGEGNTATIPFVVLSLAYIVGEMDVFRYDVVLHGTVFFHPNSEEDVSNQGSFKRTVHHGAVEPIDTKNLLDSSPHGVPSVAGALKCASDAVLREIIHKLVKCQIQGPGDESVHGDPVFRANSMLNRPMIAVKVIALGDETVDG